MARKYLNQQASVGVSPELVALVDEILATRYAGFGKMLEDNKQLQNEIIQMRLEISSALTRLQIIYRQISNQNSETAAQLQIIINQLSEVSK